MGTGSGKKAEPAQTVAGDLLVGWFLADHGQEPFLFILIFSRVA